MELTEPKVAHVQHSGAGVLETQITPKRMLDLVSRARTRTPGAPSQSSPNEKRHSEKQMHSYHHNETF